jgi:hypothetical protein
MTRFELLKRMNLTPEEHEDLMKKYETFAASLNENQQKVVTRSLMTLEQARKTFGPHTTIEDIENLVGPIFAAANASCNGAQSSPLPAPPPPAGK